MVATAFALQPSICGAQSGIGSAASVRNQVEGIRGGQPRSLSSGSAVYSQELIRSGEASVAELVFVDQTKLSVGPKSEVRLDKFVYDPNKGVGKVVVEASRGAYRFVTGVQDHRNYEIKTPYASIGVRGTVFEMNLEDVKPRGGGDPAGSKDAPDDRACRSYEKIKLVSGEIQVKTISGKTTTVTKPDTVLTVCSSGSFGTAQMADSILNFTPDMFAITPSDLATAILTSAAVSTVILEGQKENRPASP
jgi:hypothetical protein